MQIGIHVPWEVYIKIFTDFDPCSSRRVNNNNHHFLNVLHVHVHVCTIILWLFTNLSQNIYCTQSSGNIYISDQRIQRVPSQWVCFSMSRPRQGYAVRRTVGTLAAMTLRRERCWCNTETHAPVRVVLPWCKRPCIHGGSVLNPCPLYRPASRLQKCTPLHVL